MDDLYGDLEEDLRKWFGRKGAPGKKKGWVDCNTCRKDKKTGRKKCSACGRSSGEKRSKYPACRPTPSACGKRGKWGKKSKKKSKKNEELYMDLERIIIEELSSVLNESVIDHIQYDVEDLADDGMNAKQIFNNLMSTRDDLQGKEQEVKAAIVKLLNIGPQSIEDETGQARLEELEAMIDEKRKKKKKKKKKAKRDACYHKVKSRYKVWPSAYASGALVKCRKVGAKNWGNSKKESLQIMVEDEIAQVLHEKEEKYKKHDMYNPKTGEKHVASVEKDHNDMAEKGFVHVDPEKIEKILRDEGGAAGMDPFLKQFGDEMKDEITKALNNMPNVGQHEDGDYILDDDKEVNISEGMNCGCGQDPCKTYGKNNAKIKVSIAEEIEKVLEEALYYGLIEENIEEKKKKRKKKACKPSKGKKFARRVKGKCVSYGQSGKAKGGGPRIKPGTGKGNAYCARSYGDMKSHGKDCSGKDRGTPLCLSRQKWKCSGKYSRKGK